MTRQQILRLNRCSFSAFFARRPLWNGCIVVTVFDTEWRFLR